MFTKVTKNDPTQILSISEVTKALKALLQEHIPFCWLRGEISNLRKQASGHYYFTLKDHQSQIAAVLFKGNAFHYGKLIREGAQVIVYGSISIYEPRGTYQIILEHVLQDGQGLLQLRLSELKRKLEAEGYFASERKKPLPAVIKKIVVISSPQGAAIHDFLSVLKTRKWTGNIILLPSSVQGDNASKEMIQQIANLKHINGVDLLIITRGGGSIEDLWPFNEEALVRALFNCPIPIISAVGHETDFTLCDFTADVRAPTPTAAAEYVINQYNQSRDRVKQNASTLYLRAYHKLSLAIKQFNALYAQFAPFNPKYSIENSFLKLDDLSQKLKMCLFFLKDKQETLLRLNKRFTHLMAYPKTELMQVRLNHLFERLEHCHPKNILKRGFAYIETPDGRAIIATQKELFKTSFFKVTLQDGSVEAFVKKSCQS